MIVRNGSATWKFTRRGCRSLLKGASNPLCSSNECVRKRTDHLISVALSGDHKRWLKTFTSGCFRSARVGWPRVLFFAELIYAICVLICIFVF